MVSEEKIYDHVLELRPGTKGKIVFHFPTRKRTVNVAVKTVDPKNGTAELLLDDLWRGYEMMQFVKDEDRWTSIWPGPDGNVHAVIGLGARENLNISSDDALYHSLQLTEATWKGDALRLTFRESAE